MLRWPLAVILTAPLTAQTLDELRGSLRDSARGLRYSAYLATVLGLSEEATLSGASFSVDDGPGPDTAFQVWSYPLDHTFELSGALPPLRLEADLGYAKTRVDYADAWDGELPGLETRLISEFEAFGGVVGAGPVVDAFGWKLSPIALIGVSHLENDASYAGPGAAATQALTSGILFDFDATFLSYGGALVTRSPDWALGEVDVHLDLRLDWRHTETLQSDDPAQDGSDDQSWGAARVTFEGPVGLDLFDRQLRWTGGLGYKRFLDQTGDLIGFDDYWEIGGGVLWDCRELVPLLSAVGLQGALLIGEDVRGWTFGGTVRF